VNALAALPPHQAEWRSYCIDVGLPEQLQLDAFLCRGDSLESMALITAGVHGDEYEGPAAVAALARVLAAERLHGSVIAVPVVNPPAFAAAQRLSPLDGLNLARCFPGQPDGKPTERLACWFFEQFASSATYIIDLHSGGVEYQFLPVAGFYGAAAPGNPSFDAARRFGLEHLWKLPETAGVLSCEKWKQGGIAIGCEYLGRGQLAQEGSRAYASGVLSCLAHWGILDGRHALPAGGRAFEGNWHLASATGIFRSARESGSLVCPGDLIAEIVDVRGCVIQRFIASSRGVVLGLRSKAYIREGDWAVLIGTPLEDEL
jgi:predicted deacylase